MKRAKNTEGGQDGHIPKGQVASIRAADPADIDLTPGDLMGIHDVSDLFGRELDPEETFIWASMSWLNREATLKRLEALRRWDDNRGIMTAAEAAESAGLGLARFYDLAAQWRDGSRRLVDFARYAKRPGDRKGKFSAGLLNELQAVVGEVVSKHPKKSVTKQVLAMVNAINVGSRGLPSKNLLREIVERERRRQLTRQQAGTELALDYAEVIISSAGDHHWTVFAAIDRTSRLILGYALGDPENSRLGHTDAAKAARSWLASPQASGIPWAPQTERVDIVPGGDRESYKDIDRLSCPVECGFADGAKSQGRYFRKFVGPRIGQLQLSAVKQRNERLAAQPSSTELALANIQIKKAVADHNHGVMDDMQVTGEQFPNKTTIQTLDWLAKLSGPKINLG